ncbi:MAG: helix-turn-helix transcriptional regulator [Spirochaetaceae bacterium]|nr:helix-turn-helix transcriptional regulator [Spirochaetaceae bacterium]
MEAAELQKILSCNIKELRSLRGMSQMKLAEKADLSVSYVCDIESGRRWGTPETFTRLAKALEVSPFELLIPQSHNPSVAVSSNVPPQLMAQCYATVRSQLQENITQAVAAAIATTFLGESS